MTPGPHAATYFGRGSLAHRMVMAALRANPYMDLTVCALDDGAGAAAAGTVTFATVPTGSGVATLYIGNDRVEIAVAILRLPLPAVPGVSGIE